MLHGPTVVRSKPSTRCRGGRPPVWLLAPATPEETRRGLTGFWVGGGRPPGPRAARAYEPHMAPRPRGGRCSGGAGPLGPGPLACLAHPPEGDGGARRPAATSPGAPSPPWGHVGCPPTPGAPRVYSASGAPPWRRAPPRARPPALCAAPESPPRLSGHTPPAVADSDRDAWRAGERRVLGGGVGHTSTTARPLCSGGPTSLVTPDRAA